MLSFAIDRGAAPVGVVVNVPNVEYHYLDPGLAVRVPLSSRLALCAAGRFLLVESAGEVQQADQYGAAKMTGFDADAALELRATPRVLLRAGARYLAIAFAFDGSGAMTTSRDGDPTSVNVGGALDRYLGGYASAGYLF